jgi:hypothetical protein
MPIGPTPPRHPPSSPIQRDANLQPNHPPANGASVPPPITASTIGATPALAGPTVSRSSHLISRRFVVPPSGDASPAPAGDVSVPADIDDRPLIVAPKPPSTGRQQPWLKQAERPPAAAAMQREPETERSDVRISIGRLEVRAHIAAPLKPEHATEPFRPQLTLQEYLTRRSGGR